MSADAGVSPPPTTARSWVPEHIYGYTGTRPPRSGDFSLAECQLIAAQTDDLPADALVVTGGCLGADGLIMRAAARRGLARRALLPALTTQTDWESLDGAEIVRTRLSPPDRDRVLVRQVQHLRAIGLYEPGRMPRSGTYLTAREGQRRGILERLIVLRAREGARGQWQTLQYDGPDICVCHPSCPCAWHDRCRPCGCLHHVHAT